MEKKEISMYFMIIMVGFIVVVSFFQFKIGEFDWPFFIGAIVYVVFSTVTGFFVVSAIVSRNPKVVAARLRVNDAYDKIEAGHLWAKYKEAYIHDHTITTFYEAYCYYAFTNDYHSQKRSSLALSKANFKHAFLKKQLKQATAGEKINPLRKAKMLALQNDQDDVSHIDNARLKYRRGFYLGKPASDYVKAAVSFVVQIVSLGLSIFSIVKFETVFSRELLLKFLSLGVLVIADIYWIYSNARNDIRYWVNQANDLSAMADVVVENRDSGITKTIAYYEFTHAESSKE